MSSMKFKSITAIKNEIAKKIDECQEIKRYMLYLTDSPLSSKAKLSDGKFIAQPDITKSLIGENIIPYMYYDEIIEKQKVLMFVHTHYGNFGTGSIGENIISIDIVCPTNINILPKIGEERIITIADYITDLLDGTKLESSLAKLCFESYTVFRVSKDSDYVGITINCIARNSNLRSNS